MTPPRLSRVLFSVFILLVAAWPLPEARAQAVLQVSPAPPQTAMGGLGVALPVTDAHGFFYNPAQLGLFGRNATVAVRGYPTRADWFVDDLSMRSTALSAGYDFSERLGVPLSVGAGYARSSFDLGTYERRNADNEFVTVEDARDRSDAFSAGIGFGRVVSVSVGATFKRFRADAVTAVSEETASANAFDVGALVSVPLVERGPSLTGLDGTFGNAFSFGVDASLGYAVLNIGDEVRYTEGDPGVQLPRAARLGYGVTAGLDYDLGGSNARVRLAEIRWSVEAEDDLRACSYGADRPCEEEGHQGPFGDIAPLDNIVLMRGSDAVTRRRGVRLDLAETLQLHRGGFDGAGYDEAATHGWGVRTQGALKLLTAGGALPGGGGSTLRFLADHFDLRYFSATRSAGDDTEIGFRSLSLVVRGF